jgi:hypothetical protein
VNDAPLAWRIAAVRGEMLELGSAVRQLHRWGLDSASAELLLSRKRAELEDLMNQARHGELGRSDYVSEGGLVRPCG